MSNFPFGAAPQNSSNYGFTFNQNTPAVSAFGQSATSPANTTFSFGSAAGTTTAPNANPFGAAQPTAQATPGKFNFGQTAPAFGQTSAAPAFGSTQQTSTSTFGVQPAGQGLFGSTSSFASPQPTSTFGTFGQASAPATTPAFSFNTPASTTTNVFGSTSTTSTFGNPQATTSTSNFSFGQAPTTAQTQAFSFGQPQGQQQAPAATGTSSGFSAFSSTTAPAFGQATSTAPSITGSAFGNTAPPAFGQPAASTGLSFGQQAATTAPAFGQPATTTTPAFGQAGTSSFSFGGAQTTGGISFGTPAAPAPASTASSTFGSFMQPAAQQSTAATGLSFGQAANPAPATTTSSFSFAQPASTAGGAFATPTGFGFGAAAPATTTAATPTPFSFSSSTSQPTTAAPAAGAFSFGAAPTQTAAVTTAATTATAAPTIFTLGGGSTAPASTAAPSSTGFASTAGFSFGATGAAPSAATSAATAPTGQTAPAPSLGGFSFNAPTSTAPTATAAPTPSFSFGSTPAATTSQPASTTSAPQATTLAAATTAAAPTTAAPTAGAFSFGAPAAAPTATTSAPSATGTFSFGAPTATTAAATAAATTVSQPTPGAPTTASGTSAPTSAPISFSFGASAATPASSASTQPATATSTAATPGSAASTTSTSGTSTTAASTMSFGGGGLGSTGTGATTGTTTTTTSSLTATTPLSTEPPRPKTVKDEKLPLEMQQLVEALERHLQQQKSIRDELDKNTLIPVEKSQAEIDALRLVAGRIETTLQRNHGSLCKLKNDTLEERNNCELAIKTNQLRLSGGTGVFEDGKQNEYFQKMVMQFHQRVRLYRQQIFELQGHFGNSTQNSNSNGTIHTANDVSMILKKSYETFVTLASQIYNLHEQTLRADEDFQKRRRQPAITSIALEIPKARKTDSPARRSFHEPKSISPSKLFSRNTQMANALHNITLRAGLDSSFDQLHPPMSSAATPSAVASIFTPQHPAGGMGLFGHSTTMNQSVLGSGPANLFGANTSFNATQFNSPIQLQSPPVGNKRGKR